MTCVYLFWCVVSPDLCVSVLVCGQHWPVCIYNGVWSAMTYVYLFWWAFTYAGWGPENLCASFLVCLCLQGEAMTMCVSIFVCVHMCISRGWVTLQALVYDSLPPITAICDYAIHLWKPSAKVQLFLLVLNWQKVSNRQLKLYQACFFVCVCVCVCFYNCTRCLSQHK